jgi:hypothetical protein
MPTQYVFFEIFVCQSSNYRVEKIVIDPQAFLDFITINRILGCVCVCVFGS